MLAPGMEPPSCPAGMMQRSANGGGQGNAMEYLPDSSAGGLQGPFLGTSAVVSEKVVNDRYWKSPANWRPSRTFATVKSQCISGLLTFWDH